LLSALAIIQATFCSAAPAQTSWNIPRFASDPAALYQAAAGVNSTPETLVVVLDEEDDYVFDADGKAVHTRYMVYKILAQQAVEGWGGVSLGWEPWHDERPMVRARVLAPDQVVHQLDPKTITDAAAKDDDEDIYGDSRVVRAPLPAIAPGAIVEEEDVLKESVPFFGAGVVTRIYFGRPVPVQRRQLVLDAPASLPVKYAITLLPNMQPQKAEHEGRMHLVFEQSPIEALDDPETYLPSDLPAQPHVEFSTGVSWQSIAAAYAKIVDEKAAAKDVQGLVNNLVAAKNTRQERAAARGSLHQRAGGWKNLRRERPGAIFHRPAAGRPRGGVEPGGSAVDGLEDAGAAGGAIHGGRGNRGVGDVGVGGIDDNLGDRLAIEDVVSGERPGCPGVGAL